MQLISNSLNKTPLKYFLYSVCQSHNANLRQASSKLLNGESIICSNCGNSHTENPRGMDRSWPNRPILLRFERVVLSITMPWLSRRSDLRHSGERPLRYTYQRMKCNFPPSTKTKPHSVGLWKSRGLPAGSLPRSPIHQKWFLKCRQLLVVFNRKLVSCFQLRCLNDSNSWSDITVLIQPSAPFH